MNKKKNRYLKKPSPKRRKLTCKNKFWEKLKGTYQEDATMLDHKQLAQDVERLIAAVQQDMIWDDKDIKTWDMIQEGIVDWSGEISKKYRGKKK